MSARIEVIGLKEFVRELRVANAQLPNELRRGLNAIGKEILVPEVKKRVRASIKDPSRSRGSLLKSVTSKADRTSASVKEGTPSRVPYAGWWEFGGPTARSSRPPNREFVPKGRAMYPALVAKRDEIQKEADDLIDRMTRLLRAGTITGF